jgi:hypothetical protein
MYLHASLFFTLRYWGKCRLFLRAASHVGQYWGFQYVAFQFAMTLYAAVHFHIMEDDYIFS